MDQLFADIAKNWPIIFSACIITATGVWLILTMRGLKDDLNKHTQQDDKNFTQLSSDLSEFKRESANQHRELRDLVAKEFQHLDEKSSGRVKTVHERLDRIQEK